MEDEKREFPYDLIGGEFIDPLVVRTKHVLGGSHKGTVYVVSGKIRIDGQHDGSLNLRQSSEAEVMGLQNGTVNIDKGSLLKVSGLLEGTVNIDQGGVFILEESGRLSGTVFNDGEFYLRGVFGGFVNGEGVLKIEGSGVIKKPVVRDRVKYFEW